VDKLILGAVIAAGFVAYDQWKVQEAQRYEEAVQRAEYLKEFVPIVVNSDDDVLVRAQALVALIDRRAVDPRTAFVLTERLLRSGLMFWLSFTFRGCPAAGAHRSRGRPGR
jgi:hypothetical protein